MQQGLPKPERRSIHCGVLDFTAGDGCICLPQWLMDNLKISDSDMLSVANITLPKGRYVKLQPHTLLKDIKTKQKLESALRQFTTLSADTTIIIESMNNLKLNIVEVKPNKNNLNSIQIIDTDLVVEFEAALDGSTETQRHFERNLVLNEAQNEDIITDCVHIGEYRFYKLLFDASLVETIQINVTPQNKQDLDLYASFSCYEPGTTSNDYDYHCVESGAAQLIINNDNNKSTQNGDDDNGSKTKHLYIGVHGFEHNEIEEKDNENMINYELKVSDISMNDLEMQNLQRASSLTMHVDDNENETNEKAVDLNVPICHDVNKKFCPNCRRFVNKFHFDRHIIHCKKQFFFCVPCKKSIKMSEVEAHNKTFHSNLKCKLCDEVIVGGKKALIAHQKYECLRRPINCKYCHLPFAFLAHAEHEQMCGSRTEQCAFCNEYIALSLIEQHCIDVHGMEYEAPLGIARMQSDESVNNEPTNMALGGYNVVPNRILNENGDEMDEPQSNANERWICSSCDFNNRPNHTHCKICKVKRTKFMKKVSQITGKKGKSSQKKSDYVEKIGGNSSNIPQRDYDALLKAENEKSENIATPTIKPPLIQYNERHKNGSKIKENDSDVVIGSTVDPSLIPTRDYDKMLNAEDIDDSGAFLVDNCDNANDVQMDIDNKLSTTDIEAIPQRDYDSMLNKSCDNMQIDSEQLIEQMAKEMVKNTEDANKNKAQYRSITAVIPKRNYDQMVKQQQITSNSNGDVEMKENGKVSMVTSRDGKWVCPNVECNFLNKATRNNCSVCHTLKPSYKRTAALLDDSIDQLGLDKRWVCKSCNGLNKGSRQNCVFCHAVKSFEPKSKNAAKQVIASSKKKKIQNGIFQDMERWVCPNEECNFLNKGSRIQCQVCHTQRKDHNVIIGDKAKEVIDDTKIKVMEKKKQQKKEYSHPLEARMMGMDVDKLHNIPKANNENNKALEWACPICTFLNTGSKCEMCGCPKDAN